MDQTKVARLQECLRRLGSVAVAFSAGADSTLLLACSLQVLGPDKVLAVTADSPTLPRQELAEARDLAAQLGARLRIIVTEELADPDFASNPPNRCYHCKRELFARMRQVADEEGFRHLVYGATADDLGDHRPGMRAAEEAGALAPLLVAGLTKKEVRALSRYLGLPTWDKPAMACLASRFPYGAGITADGLARVEQAEAFLREHQGLRQVRVRDQGSVARIEVALPDLPRLVDEATRKAVVSHLKHLGYTYVTLNLEPYRSGSLNDLLGAASRERLTSQASFS